MPGTAETNIYERLTSAPLHHPASADLFVNDWALETGDVVTVESNGETYNVPIFSMNYAWFGGPSVDGSTIEGKAEIQSTGNQEREPLSELKRKRYASGSGAYRAQKEDLARFIDNEEMVGMIASDLQGLDASLTLTASQIRAEVSDSNNALSSAITQTASQIRAEVSDSNNSLSSAITQTASQIRAEVSDSNNSLSSAITQTASQIRAEVSDSNNSLSSAITQTASQIRAEVNNTAEGLASSITQTASQIRSEVSDSVSGLHSQITQTASSIRSEVASSISSAYHSIIEQTDSHIRSEVGSAVSGIYTSVIEQTGSYIRSEIEAAASEITSSVIEQTGSYIRSEIEAAASGVTSSVIIQTESYVRSQVATKSKVYRSDKGSDPASDPNNVVNDGDIWIIDNDIRKWEELNGKTWDENTTYMWDDYYGNVQYVRRNGEWVLVDSWKDTVSNSIAIRQNEENIEIFGRKLDQYETEWSIGIDELDVKYRDKTNKLDSQITITASVLRSEYNDRANGLTSLIEQTASQIRTEVTNSVSGLSSSITQTASQIRSEVSNSVTDLQSSITQQADRISLVVEGTGANAHIKPAAIVSSINNGASSIVISANHIDLDGYVKATDLTTDFLNAKISQISTLTGIAASFSGNVSSSSGVIAPYVYLGVGGAELGTGIRYVRISGPSSNTYTLQYMRYRDSSWQSGGSFSRAVTSWSGSWGSGKISVSVSPQGQSQDFNLPSNATWRRVWDDIQGFYIYYCTVAGKQYSHVFD